MGWLGREVRVRVEIPRGGRVKRKPDGRIDYISPFAAPFNYGFVVGEIGGDGDPLDAILLGPAASAGAEVVVVVRGVVHFRDHGLVDDKLVCCAKPVTAEERRQIERFFRWYAPLRHLVDLVKLRPGRLWTEGIEWEASGDPR